MYVYIFLYFVISFFNFVLSFCIFLCLLLLFLFSLCCTQCTIFIINNYRPGNSRDAYHDARFTEYHSASLVARITKERARWYLTGRV